MICRLLLMREGVPPPAVGDFRAERRKERRKQEGGGNGYLTETAFRGSKGKERGSPLPYLSPLCSVPFRVSQYSALTSCLLPPTSSLCMVLPETIHTAVFPPLPACFRSMEAGTARPVCFRSMPAGAPRLPAILTDTEYYGIIVSEARSFFPCSDFL